MWAATSSFKLFLTRYTIGQTFPYQFNIMLKGTYLLLTIVLSLLNISSAILFSIESCGLKPLSLYTYHTGSADSIEITSGCRCCLWTRHHDFTCILFRYHYLLKWRIPFYSISNVVSCTISIFVDHCL